LNKTRKLKKKGKVIIVAEELSDGSEFFSVDIAGSRVSFKCISLTEAEKVFDLLTDQWVVDEIET